MQIIADLHTHTLSATHAFNTLDEMAAKAAALGYAALAITDHGPAMPDAPHMWHFPSCAEAWSLQGPVQHWII